MLPRCEFRPLDFGVNRCLLLSWCLRAKQGHTDAQPKRAGCPSGAGVRISWWASQPCSIRLGTAEPEDLPARCVGVWSGGRRVCGTRRRICRRGASMCHPRDRRAGGSRGTAPTSADNRHRQQTWPTGTDNRHGQTIERCRRHERGQEAQTTDTANRHSQQARPKDRKVPPPRERPTGTDNRHSQQTRPTDTAKRRKGAAPSGAAPLCSPSDAIRSGQRWTGPSAGSWCERSQRRSRSYAGRPSGR